MASDVSPAAPLLELVYNHIALPRKLPDRGDDGRVAFAVEQNLINRCIDACRVVVERADTQYSHQWERTRRVLQSCKEINIGGRIDKSALLREFQSFDKDFCLIIHIVEQNAGLLVRQYQDSPENHIVFEAFEAAPQSESVLAAKNALLWDFPGSAIAVPASTFFDSGFQKNLATFLGQASSEPIKRFSAQARKANVSTQEERDTTDPALITQMLMTLLEVNGYRTYPMLSRKRVRDDVCWKDAQKPWRRCPLWLTLRVSLQRHLSSMLGGRKGRCLYKFLICVVHARLLEDAIHQLGPDLLFFLKAKLCRRLVKLQKEMSCASSDVSNAYRHMFDILEPFFLRITQNTTKHVEKIWKNFKASIHRPISVLPRSAGQRDLELTLPNSGLYLTSILNEASFHRSRIRPHPAPQLLRRSEFSTTVHHLEKFQQRYFALAQLEVAIEDDVRSEALSAITTKDGCLRYAAQISKYLSAVSNSYNDCAEQKSIMLLTVMELFCALDRYACDEFNLLAEFHPGFAPELLDVLQLPHLRDFRRLQQVQGYLRERVKCGVRTIFEDPIQGCFAERMYNASPALQALHQEVESKAAATRKEKEEEWRERSAEYDSLVRKISEMSHIYITQHNSFDQIHARDCPRCKLERTSSRMRIQIHEHPLPTNQVLAKAVIFELQTPASFAAYRDATWRIISTLGHARLVDAFPPKVLISEYSELRGFRSSSTTALSLASTTKSFLLTHYSHLRFPVTLDEVCRPNGLKVGYYDEISKVWPGRMSQRWSSFAHHCRIDPACPTIPSLLSSPTFSPDQDGPSSYDIIAGQTKSPQSMNVHEFMAFQALFSGWHRRWMVILNELGSSNLNFSTEATYTVISYLILQAGPQRGKELLRTTHVIFGDSAFCRRLIDQIKRRLADLKYNYRESFALSIILSITLRLSALAEDLQVRKSCQALLEEIRAMTHHWLDLLRTEIQKAVDPKTSQDRSRNAIWAALLCRHTFSCQSTAHVVLQAGPLQCFIECSIALQDNVAGDPLSFPLSLRNALIRDAKMVHQLRFLLRRSLESHSESLRLAIRTVWPDSESGSCRTFSQPQFASHPNEWWFECVILASEQMAQQMLQYNLLNGQLLIDGEPLGRLPADYRKSIILTELFGAQTLLTLPSALPGMSFVVSTPMHGHQIHLGQRDGKTVIRACVCDTVLELIPRDVFHSEDSFDLPISLVRGCVHWLDLKTGIMEIRKVPNLWRVKDSNWCVNIHTRLGTRRTVALVDPQSRTFRQVAGIFSQFEFPRELTVFQPSRRPLSVELRRLELSFFVNRDRCLESSQLKAYIEPNQDAGTWYGLSSKLCLRDTANIRKRSVIVPFGHMSCKRNGFHVMLKVENSGQYARFHINEVLGRIESSMEPRILYLKAQLHAFSSFVLPDPLTGRTGTEESLDSLRSFHPWSPLKPVSFSNLPLVANLTPKRHYYPQNGIMQKVEWDDRLTTTIQHDAFRELVETISRKSENLSTFASTKLELQPLVPPGDRHLLGRSIARYSLYERSYSALQPSDLVEDMPYSARDRFKDNQGHQNVFECVSVIHTWTPKIHSTVNLAEMLQIFPVIGGHYQMFDKMQLTDRLSISWGSEWGSLVELCKTCDKRDIFRAEFLFAVMAFGADVNMDLLRVLAVFAVCENLKSLDPPVWPSYSQFRRDQIPHVNYLVQLMKTCCFPFTDDVLGELKFNLSYKQRKRLEAAELAYKDRCEKNCTTFAEFLFAQWPCLELSLEKAPEDLLVSIPKAMELIRPEFERLFRNTQFGSYLQLVQEVLNRTCVNTPFQPARPAAPNEGQFHCRPAVQSRCYLQDLLCSSGPTLPPLNSTVNTHDSQCFVPGASAISQSRQLVSHRTSPASYEMQELQRILEQLNEHTAGKQKSTVRERYALDLSHSLDAFRKSRNRKQGRNTTIPAGKFAHRITEAASWTNEGFKELRQALENHALGAQWYLEGGLWPCTTPLALLQHLRSTCATKFGKRMKEALVACGVSLTKVQRLMRMEEACIKGNTQVLEEEESNTGYTWDPLKYTDWLLLQIDCDFLIRPGQAEVAFATLTPSSGSNSVLQMNMGQGKTSCIMPMVSAIAADRKQLSRVIVPKALLLQTAQILQARLGGLLGREIRHVPFSRKTPTDHDTIKLYGSLHLEIMKSSGVMLCLPEHILSFRLSGIQRLSDGRHQEAKQMIQADNWIKRSSRDVLDECDVTLAVRTQLIYPSGSLNTVDGHPHRWQTAETLLGLITGHLWSLQESYPRGIEVHYRTGGGFPVIYLLRREAEEGLLTCLINDVCSGRISALPVKEISRSDRQVIRHFLSQPKIRHEIAEQVDRIFISQPTARKVLYLLRGLLVHRILLLCLKKRWNVQYGLHPGRDPIAVPYHAKGVPSEQAEWGHPDVAILFTCLAFYYDGISREQLHLSLGHLLKSDDPLCEYERWIASIDKFPDSLREWNSINVDDEAQIMEIWQCVRYNVVVVDYFLNNFVFPKHAKQFRVKLQASGWDIPLLPSETKSGVAASKCLTTGFSGTNDNRTMLPLTVKQADLSTLSHTNAQVLTHLLQWKNRKYVVAAKGGRRLTETGLLRELQIRGIRILIDAGAQILEMDNLQLVKEWLRVDGEAPAAIFFDTENKPMVHYRFGHSIPLSATPFIDDLTDCLVYLDQAHCRGTDLKFPIRARGALTLGQDLTKDTVVQAAMRLRQLATTQSVTFFVPLEVHQSIMDVCGGKKADETFDSSHVIRWLLEQTCSGIEQLQPLYYAQGADFCRRIQAATDNPEFASLEPHRDTYLGIVRQNEQQTVQQLYKPRTQLKSTKAKTTFSPTMAAYMKELDMRRKGFQDNGNAVQSSTLQEVEQEREVAHEVEAVREVQKPVHFSPLAFPGLHRDIESFLRTGRLAAGSAGYELALDALARTGLGIKHAIGPGTLASRLFVSQEFRNTIKLIQGRPNDSFLRPVEWVLWSTYSELAMAIIPEEAEIAIQILRDLQDSNQASPTHLLSYSAPITRRMLHFNRLNYYAFPSMPEEWEAPTWLTIELGIFAGRLYFHYEEYEELLNFLGLCETVPMSSSEHENSALAPPGVDGVSEAIDELDVNAPNDDQAREATVKSTTLSLSFLQEWLAVRRKGQDFMHTPMGYVCQGKSLKANHPFFARADRADSATTTKHQPVQSIHVSEDSAAVEDEVDDFAYEGDFLKDEEVEMEDGDWNEDFSSDSNKALSD